MARDRDRFAVLDSWRGLAALFVACFPFTTIWSLDGGGFINHSWIFVDFFFVLSGFVIAHSYSARLASAAGIFDFVLRRIGRLWPLHMLMLCLLAALQLAKLILNPVGALPDASHGMLGFLSASLFLHSTPVWPSISLNGPSWSISAEFWSYLLFAGIVFVAASRGLTMALFAVWVGALVLLLIGPARLETYAEFAVVRCLYGFLAGALTYQLWRRLRDKAMFGGRVAHVLEIAVVMSTGLFVVLWANTGYQFLAPFAFALGIFVFAFERGAVSAVLQFRPFLIIGDLSYSIYMTHSLLREILRIGIHAMADHDKANLLQELANPRALPVPHAAILWSLLAAFLISTLCLSVVTRRWVEKPGQRLFSATADRIRRRPALSPA
jgi:peptidoglycan/LPS O-acetylase OafA/YrhL